MNRSLEVAQHEAAHIVVGVALGLRLYEARLGWCREGPWWFEGYAEFHDDGPSQAWACMLAAGVAWDRALGCDAWGSSVDLQLCQEQVGKANAEVCVKIAAHMLRDLARAHTRVTRMLLDRDLTAADIQAMAYG
jgi:hypothetical protein